MDLFEYALEVGNELGKQLCVQYLRESLSIVSFIFRGKYLWMEKRTWVSLAVFISFEAWISRSILTSNDFYFFTIRERFAEKRVNSSDIKSAGKKIVDRARETPKRREINEKKKPFYLHDFIYRERERFSVFGLSRQKLDYKFY